MQRQAEAAGPSRPTQTITVAPPSSSSSGPTERAGTLRLRGHRSDARRVKWTNNTVDNEHLGRKSSKICCIYHKPKDFDESSSDASSSSASDSQDTGDEHDVNSGKAAALKRKIQQKRQRQEGECCARKHDASSSSSEEKSSSGKGSSTVAHNAYEKGVK